MYRTKIYRYLAIAGDHDQKEEITRLSIPAPRPSASPDSRSNEQTTNSLSYNAPAAVGSTCMLKESTRNSKKKRSVWYLMSLDLVAHCIDFSFRLPRSRRIYAKIWKRLPCLWDKNKKKFTGCGSNKVTL